MQFLSVSAHDEKLWKVRFVDTSFSSFSADWEVRGAFLLFVLEIRIFA